MDAEELNPKLTALWQSLGIKGVVINQRTPHEKRVAFKVTHNGKVGEFLIGHHDAENTDDEGMKKLMRREYADVVKHLS